MYRTKHGIYTFRGFRHPRGSLGTHASQISGARGLLYSDQSGKPRPASGQDPPGPPPDASVQAEIKGRTGGSKQGGRRRARFGSESLT